MDKYKFSIIIPHRNIPSLLRRCLDSIPHRDDVQIIVVDDNSDADKVDFSKFPGINEKNTEVYFTKEGKGAGYARNVGLKHAKGEWLLFADADDMFMPQIEDAFEFCSRNQADVIYLGSCAKDSETLEPSNEMDWEKELLFESAKGHLSDVKYRIYHPWAKIFSKSFIDEHKIFFEEVFCSNDTRFSIYCDYYAKQVTVLHDINTYCYMIRKGSLWHNKSLKWAETNMGVMMRLAKFMGNVNECKQELAFCDSAWQSLHVIKTFSKTIYAKKLIGILLNKSMQKYIIAKLYNKIR